jgi:two-component system, NarL family, response regulator LiaR
MIRIVIVDDHPVVRDGLAAMLSRVDAIKLARALKPDVILMDLEMPLMDGATAIRQLRDADPATRVLVLTAYDTDERILHAIQAGAQGYLLKGVPRDELFRGIRIVNEGGSLLQPAVAAKLLTHVGQLLKKDDEDALTDRELEVLGLLTRGLRNKEIAEKLIISERTVKFHVGVIFQKLGVSNRAEAVSRAIQKRLVQV